MREQLDSEQRRSDQLRKELGAAEIEKTRVAARLEGMEAALAHQANPPTRKGKSAAAKHADDARQLELDGSQSNETSEAS